MQSDHELKVYHRKEKGSSNHGIFMENQNHQGCVLVPQSRWYSTRVGGELHSRNDGMRPTYCCAPSLRGPTQRYKSLPTNRRRIGLSWSLRCPNTRSGSEILHCLRHEFGAISFSVASVSLVSYLGDLSSNALTPLTAAAEFGGMHGLF